MRRQFSPPDIYKIFMVIMLVTVFPPFPTQIHLPYNLIGILFFIGGAYIAIDTKRMFKKTQTPVSHLATPVKLHTEGVFQKTRNPMYLGITVGLGGVAVLTGAIYNLIFPILYMVIMTRYFILPEEKELEKAFGAKYREYKTKTKRWL